MGVPLRWWRERAIVARRALRAGNVSEAYSLTKNHGLDKDHRPGIISAEWLAGWIALRFLRDTDDKKAAYTHFVTAYSHATYPISRSRGAYWAGRAAEARGEMRKASNVVPEGFLSIRRPTTDNWRPPDCLLVIG